MKLLVSTYRKLLLIELADDLNFAKTRTLIDDGNRYFGIARTPENEIWVARSGPETEDPSEIFSLNDPSRVISFEKPLADVHQITYANDGLYITNTYYNSVTYKHLETGVEHHHPIGGVFEHDYAHPNSLWVDGSYVYVLLHNKNLRTSEIARLRHSLDFGFSDGLASEIRFRLPNAACHNIRFDRGRLTYLASAASDVVMLDFLSGNFGARIKAPPGHYLKGMVTAGERLVIGMNPISGREGRNAAPAWLGIVGPRSEGFEGTIPIKLEDGSDPGDVNDIRLIPDELIPSPEGLRDLHARWRHHASLPRQ